MAKKRWKKVDGKYVGYFAFEEDQESRTAYGEDTLQFFTTPHPDNDDDCNEPPNGWDDLQSVLEPVVANIDYGASESLHIVEPCLPEDHQKTTDLIRKTLLSAGWQELID